MHLLASVPLVKPHNTANVITAEALTRARTRAQSISFWSQTERTETVNFNKPPRRALRRYSTAIFHSVVGIRFYIILDNIQWPLWWDAEREKYIEKRSGVTPIMFDLSTGGPVFFVQSLVWIFSGNFNTYIVSTLKVKRRRFLDCKISSSGEKFLLIFVCL